MTAQRDKNGRFIKGNKASSGRRSFAEELPYIEQLKQHITPEVFGGIISKLAELAQRGNLEAAKILLPHLLGNPVSRTDITTNGENISTIGITGVDYRSAITNLAPGPMGDSSTPSESESAFNGETMG